MNQDTIEAFNQINNYLVSDEVILQFPDFNKEFQLTTDASDSAIGAVLSQGDRPISFLSITLSKPEENYATNQIEMLAIVWALKTLKNELYGRAKVKSTLIINYCLTRLAAGMEIPE